MDYWKRVFRRAVREARRDLKLDTLVNAMIVFGGQFLISILIWLALGPAFTNSALWTRAIVTVAPFLLFPLVFAIRLLTVPASMAAEDEATIKSLAASKDSVERKKQAKVALGRVIEAGLQILNTGNVDEASAREWMASAHNLVASAFGIGEATLLGNHVGITFLGGGVWENHVRGWIRRLHELLVRVDALDIDTDFDPRAWQ